MKCLRFLLILDSLLLLTGQAAAQQIGDADQGLDMASKVCSECHAFELGQHCRLSQMRPDLRILPTLV